MSAPALVQTIAITGGKVAIGDGSAPIDNGTVVIANGKIAAAGAKIPIPPGAQRVDASGKWVTPGIVAGFSRVGLIEVESVESTNDAGARSPFSAAIDVAPAINPLASPVAISRAGGVTRAIVAPVALGGIFAGQGAVIDLGGDMEPITRARAFQFVELGEAGASSAGGSRAASHLLFRAMLREAQDYARAPAAYDGRSKDNLLLRADAQALVPVINGTVPLFIHVERASDILQSLALRRDFPALKLVLVGVSEGWMVADRIAAAKVPVIASALNDLPAAFERLNATQSNVGRMKKAGVSVAIGMIGDNDAHQLRYTPQYAGNLVALQRVPGATGLEWGAALATITSAPAEAAGLGQVMGSLKPGRVGDVVIWSGDPLELSSTPEIVFIDGVKQSMETRQTRLRERYRSLAPAALPKAYDR
ncbi:amidohydrolase family protein [Rhizorhapis suberifaciens]|uniref:Imidazolonepropionase-like amidohydrolase n=1 Tax=Rhizorhapis suberifaciens TaxID=13656 RepID=A0A840HPV4_9SPHN|nr:amidohydrolase family protein [Rhizorhapis suberifaciens]MBB4639945.1 imidazolonepropionase-like amidohydrolase [Rhizorhapis suberifaciens]